MRSGEGVTRKQRDYKAEYQRRIAKTPKGSVARAVARGHAPKGKAGKRAAKFLGIKAGSDIDQFIDKDKARVFGKKVPKRQFGETEQDFEDRLRELKRRKETEFKWTSEADFIESLIGLGLTEREAYTHWFS